MPTIVTVKRRLRGYALFHRLPVPPMFRAFVPLWGSGARELARTVSHHMRAKHGVGLPVSAAKTWQLVCELVPGTKPRIIGHHWAWSRSLGRRTGAPPGTVWHHSAGSYSETIEDIHVYHRDTLGWCGVAYHFVVYVDGAIHAGRPLWAMGGHALNHNDWIGVCALGNFEVIHKMDVDQKQALIYLHRWLARKYGPHHMNRRHRELPGNHTACPGRFYPFTAITEATITAVRRVAG